MNARPTSDDDSATRPIGRFERLLFRRVPLWLLLIAFLLGLCGFIVFGALVKSGLEGSRRYGVFAEAAVTVASIPSTLVEAAAAAAAADLYYRAPEPRQALPDGWSRPVGSSFEDDGYALVSRYAPARRRAVVQLIRLSDGHVLREYAPDIAAINALSNLDTAQFDLDDDRGPSRYRMKHPYLMPDGGLIFHNTSPLVRIDACSRVVWTMDGIFHHSLERDAAGAFWVSITSPRTRRPNVSERFQEDGIARVTARGNFLYKESLMAIFDRNGLGGLYQGRPYVDDPFHLNDIEPVRESGPHWQRGDLFLSMRHLSVVLLYRPATGRVLWWRQGPWSGQHDVNILDDHRISIFDNHTIAGYPRDYVRGTNRILVYDFATDSISAPFERALSGLEIRTIWEGRASPLPNGDFFVEESNYGRLMRLAPEGEVRWSYISADPEGRRYQLGWSRYLDPRIFGGAISAATRARCG